MTENRDRRALIVTSPRLNLLLNHKNILSMEKVKFVLAQEEKGAAGVSLASKELSDKTDVSFTIVQKWQKKDGDKVIGDLTSQGSRGCWILVDGVRMWANLSQIIVAANKVPEVKAKLIDGNEFIIGDGTVLVGSFDKRGSILSIALASSKGKKAKSA